MIRCLVHLLISHLADIMSIVVVVLLSHKIIILSWLLLVPAQTALQIALPNSEYNIPARFEKLLIEKLVLVEHLEVTTESEETVTTCLVLGADSVAPYFIAQFCETHILQCRNISDDILQIENIRKVFVHLSVELINA